MKPRFENILDVVNPKLTPEAETSSFGKSIALSIKGGFIRFSWDKRFAALRRVERHVRGVELPSITIYVPHTNASSVPTRSLQTIFIYLSPDLEKKPQTYVNGVVAHEIAHVVLGHHQERFCGVLTDQMEPAADALAEIWGFQCNPQYD